MPSPELPYNNSEADTKLIAAAPELLEAGKNALDLLKRVQEADDGVCPMPWPEIDALEEAIAKAVAA